MASIHIPLIYTFEAGAAIAKGKAVKLSGDKKTVVQASATTDQVIGVAQNVAANVGDLVEVAFPGGGAKGLAKASIALGDELGVNADGSVQKVASANDRIIGYAMDSAVAGDLLPMLVQLGVAKQAQA